MSLRIVGTTFEGRQEKLKDLLELQENSIINLHLFHQKDNEFDENALQIRDDKDIDYGFIPKNVAKKMHENGLEKYKIKFIAVIGKDKGNLGMLIEVIKGEK